MLCNVLSIYCGDFSSNSSRKTSHSSAARARYGMSIVEQGLIEVLQLLLLHCVRYGVIYDRDISRVCNNEIRLELRYGSRIVVPVMATGIPTLSNVSSCFLK